MVMHPFFCSELCQRVGIQEILQKTSLFTVLWGTFPVDVPVPNRLILTLRSRHEQNILVDVGGEQNLKNFSS